MEARRPPFPQAHLQRQKPLKKLPRGAAYAIRDSPTASTIPNLSVVRGGGSTQRCIRAQVKHHSPGEQSSRPTPRPIKTPNLWGIPPNWVFDGFHPSVGSPGGRLLPPAAAHPGGPLRSCETGPLAYCFTQVVYSTNTPGPFRDGIALIPLPRGCAPGSPCRPAP
jgi:hypothetical protein